MSRARPLITTALALCVAALVAVGCGGDEARPEPKAAAAEPEPAEATKQRRELERAILEAVEAQPGGKRVDAECAIERLRSTLSNETVSEAVEAVEAGGEVPRAAVDAAYQAGRRCAEP